MKIGVLLVLVAFCTGCTCTNKSVEERIISDLNAKYDNAKSFFGKDFTNHFPKRINEDNITFTDGLSPELGNLELILTNNIESNHSTELINSFKEKSIASYNAGDSCLLIVNRFARKEKFYAIELSESDKQLLNRDCYSNLLPIPNFWHNAFTTEDTYCRLPSDFKLFVLEAKAGKHFDRKYLTDGRFMPEKWKNGYSKGVAISKKRNVIIYWLLIW